MLEVRNYIRGEWISVREGREIEVRNPADQDEVIGKGFLASRREAETAIAAAGEALPAWSRMPAPKRGEIVERAADLLRAEQDDVARLLTREEGKTFADARGEIYRAYNVLNYTAGQSRRMGGVTIPSELPKNFAYTVRQPLGVVALITPWNFPICIPAWKIAPALVAGNTVVFKPSSTTPLTAARLVDIFERAGLPPGVLNLLVGSSADVGDLLMRDSRIRGISFTGSTENGTQIYTSCANRGIKAQCEMGGKNPVIVLEDADLNLAADGIVSGAFGSTGQRCTATSRAILQDSIADDMVARLRDRVSKWKVGNGLDPDVQMGPLVSQQQLKTVQQYIEIGKSEGAKLVTGGGKPSGVPRGFFIEPTIFDNVRPEFRIAREEIFGPVLSVIRAKNYEQAIEFANMSAFGLTSSIYTNDAGRIFDFCERIETGMVHVNSPTMGGEAQIPFGGMKSSGIGEREQGPSALDFYTDVKVIYIDFTGAARTSKFY
ncbi:MAG: aldehyde dehydrogenase family protein [Acidobacteria bacterium 13_1_40CM_2_56_5]|nr:MAG: aldehyde dehydrogenase family protein [Acidobacteria bacterium 13_1_40CM_2_56_5]